MKKKSTEISVNSSSGAEKVERIEKEVQAEQGKAETVKKTAQTKTKTAKGASAMGGQKTESKTAERIKKTNAESTDGKAERESKAAKARVEAALKRKAAQEERKAKRKARMEQKKAERAKKTAEKKAIIEKRAAEKKARAQKHAAERKALAEKRKAEKEEKLRQRAHAKANKNNENYKKKKERTKNKSERKQKARSEGRNKGYGGWIAAVVTLGVVTLALGTTVTVGAVEMSKNKTAMLSSHRSTMYELTGIMENVEGDLDRIRVSNSAPQQSRILTDLLVQTRLAELDLEKLPVRAETDRNLTIFVNRTARECERMLSKLRRGEALSSEDVAILEKLYETNHALRTELNSLVSNMTDKDLAGYIKKGAGNIKDALERIEKSTLPENMEKMGEEVKKMAGAGMGRTEALPAERTEGAHIEAASAEQLCVQYFSGYNIADFQCIGETVSSGYAAYNVQGYDDRGNQLFAEVSQADGTLLRFDYYEDCMGDTFDIDHAEEIAEEFLEGLGYDDMEVVRLRSNGSNVDFTFAYEEDDVVYHPDEIRIKVCRTRGIVSGFDATKYLANHKQRPPVVAKVTLGEAYGKLRKGLDVESSRLTVVETVRGERAAYEFLCSYQEERYFVFLDANTGEELSIVNVKTVS